MAKDSLRKCSHHGHNVHKLRTCNNKEIKLFGVKINVAEEEYAKNQDDLRKCKSMGNLGACNEENNDDDDDADADADADADVDADADGYLSDGLIHESSEAKSNRERRKGKPWSEEEHRSFLFGLEKLGKGDWKGISKNFVYSRTPTQVASHAQKYYLRMTATEKKKKRSSVFDVPLSEMDANSQTSPAYTSRSATIPPQVSTTYSVKTCEKPPLSPMAAGHAVFELLRPQLMVGGTYDLCQSTPMPNIPVLPIWSFSNQKFNSFPNITAKYNFIPSMAQQSKGIFTMLPSYVPPGVATASESANKDCIDLSVGSLTL